MNESAPGQTPALCISGLSFSYPKRSNVLRGITLTVAHGERVALVGPSGTGKPTLFLLVCGVLKPGAGEIAIFGKPMKPGELQPEVGLVFQNADDQLFSPSVRDDVAFGPQNLGLSKARVDARVDEALRTTGTLDLVGRPPHQLSGGEKRMVAIAGVLAMRPRLMIYDEPSSNLDIRSRRRSIRFLQHSPETLLVASHDLESMIEVCDRVVLPDEG